MPFFSKSVCTGNLDSQIVVNNFGSLQMKDADEEIQSTGEEPKAVRKRRVRKD